jgi:CRISPR-associated endonuclease/helicase Cas3
MDVSIEELLAFWAKTDGQNHYPLLYHSLFAGAVAKAYLDSRHGLVTNLSLAEPLQGSEIAAVRLVIALAALHDIGKLSPGFQGYVPQAMGAASRTRFDIRNARFFQQHHHSAVSQYFMGGFLGADIGCSRRNSATLAAVVGGHHGWYHPTRVRYVSRMEQGPWQSARESFTRLILGVLGPSDDDWGLIKNAEFPSSWILLATGLVTLADWVASSEEYAPKAAPGSNTGLPSSLFDGFYETARALTKATGLDFPISRNVQVDFSSLFPAFREANAIQAAAIELVTRRRTATMVLLEIPTGTGKTEAALSISARWIREHDMAGVYFCLPTQATSNQMFGRMKRFLENCLDNEVEADFHLLHGRSELSEDYRTLQDFQEQPDDSPLVAHSWFRSRKRGLLAPYGVGTIDQALFGALVVRHFNLRLTGLAGKVVIIDEVHAYDNYTSDLLLRLLAWLSEMKCRVVLLSATLTNEMRRLLVCAWTNTESNVDLQTISYPNVTVIEPSGQMQCMIPVVAVKEYSIEPVDHDDWVEHIVTVSETGGCVAVVCNTVGNAQELYVALRSAPRLDGHNIILLHARLPLSWRVQREEQVLALFGAEAASKRPDKTILISTQIIEQSLDIDFDIMFTDLAPVDLVIQRLGRLHRHDFRARPPQSSKPVCYWRQPTFNNGEPDFGPSKWVYEPYVLLKTWLALRDKSIISTPFDTQSLVETVYAPPKEELNVEFHELILKYYNLYRKRRREQTNAALKWVLPTPGSGRVTDFLSGACEEAEESSSVKSAFHVQTRLAPPSVEVVCIVEDGERTTLIDGTHVDIENPRFGDSAFRKSVMLSTVSVSNRFWVDRLEHSERPGTWTQSRFARNFYPVVFRGEMMVSGGNDTENELQLSNTLGLVYSRIKKEE